MGTHRGVAKYPLLNIYRALIRPVIEYGMESSLFFCFCFRQNPQNSLRSRAASAALHTPQLGSYAVTVGPKFSPSPFYELIPQTKLQPCQIEIPYETLEISEVFANPNSVLSCNV